MDMIKENEEVKVVDLEELKKTTLQVAKNDLLLKKLKFLFKEELYKEEEVKELSELYHELAVSKTYKDYLLYEINDTYAFVKVLSAETDAHPYGYKVLTFPNFSDSEVELLKASKSHCHVLNKILGIVLMVLAIITVISFFLSFFEAFGQTKSLYQGFVSAFLMNGENLILCTGFSLILLALHQFLGRKKN